MRRKVCVVTGSRAEFGLLRYLMRGIAESPGLSLQVVVTGSHLSPEHGLTYQEIGEAGFTIDERVEMLLDSNSRSAVTKSMGLGLIGFADALQRLVPDMVLVLGDRFEILSVAAASLVARIPLVHIHGGETTEGAFDEAIRHSITKMAHLHFVAAEEYRTRVMQLGESPDRVFNVGGLGVDAIKRMDLLGRADLEASIGTSLGARSILVTLHPETIEVDAHSAAQIDALLKSLDKLDDTQIVFTLPNADPGGREIADAICKFVASHPNASAHASLGQLRYLSLLKHVDAIVGNSSSGLTEAPALGTPTVNIGNRQKGRLQAPSVVTCGPDVKEIGQAMARVMTAEFRELASNCISPYGHGGSVEKIVNVLQDFPLEGILAKRFHDLPGSPNGH